MKSQVAGMDIPEEIIRGMKAVPAKEQRQEGLKISVETVQALKEIEGVKGSISWPLNGKKRCRRLWSKQGFCRGQQFKRRYKV